MKQVAGSTLRFSDSVGLGWGPSICISNGFPGNADTAGLGNHTLRTTAFEWWVLDLSVQRIFWEGLLIVLLWGLTSRNSEIEKFGVEPRTLHFKNPANSYAGDQQTTLRSAAVTASCNKHDRLAILIYFHSIGKLLF